MKNRYCKSCAVEVSRDNMAQVALIGHSRPKTQRVKNQISKRISDHAVANTWWDPSSLPKWLTAECYAQRIQPLLRDKKVREIAEAMQVSNPYAAFIRSGRRRPHPRHWQALAQLVDYQPRMLQPSTIRTVEVFSRVLEDQVRPQERPLDLRIVSVVES